MQVNVYLHDGNLLVQILKRDIAIHVKIQDHPEKVTTKNKTKN